MTVGICRLVLYLPESASLKNKRGVLEGLCTRVRRKFNVSISEIDANDLWQKAVLGVAIITNDTRYANRVLSKVVDFVEGDSRLEVLDYSMEMI